VTALLASIPSPSRSEVSLGPLTVHMYGLTLLAAIVAATLLTGYRWKRMGGEWDLVLRCAVWGVACGVVGARLYHVVTSWGEVPDPKWKGVFEVWKGGLGVWGGILFGVLAGCVIVRLERASVRNMLDAVAPGLLLAQAIGRLGNWWNQELFGTPTSRPWGLEIDPAHRPVAYIDNTTFHPTFLYELLWNLLGVAVLLIVDSRVRIRRPALFALYVSWYTAGRTVEELLRVDPSHEVLGQRLNFWVSLGIFLVSSWFFVWWQFVRGRESAGGGRRLPTRRRRREAAAAAKRPTMAIPKGRRPRP
jgi:prolipoprotein diacylglyceryl transferase